jgi:hypothetical protein
MLGAGEPEERPRRTIGTQMIPGGRSQNSDPRSPTAMLLHSAHPPPPTAHGINTTPGTTVPGGLVPSLEQGLLHGKEKQGLPLKIETVGLMSAPRQTRPLRRTQQTRRCGRLSREAKCQHREVEVCHEKRLAVRSLFATAIGGCHNLCVEVMMHMLQACLLHPLLLYAPK